MTTERSVCELNDRHRCEDIYVIGSAASMDYIAPEFFEGRTTIGVNHVYRRFRTTYTVAKDFKSEQIDEASRAGSIPVVSRGIYGNNLVPQQFECSEVFYTFGHKFNRSGESIDWSVLGTDELIVSWSTITSALHLAAYMGAKAIFLAGHDGGQLDGEFNYRGYRQPGPFDADRYGEWVQGMMPQTLQVRDKLREFYGVPTVLLSPFLNLANEGHVLS